MRIAFVIPEVYPFAKTGGLADVSYSLTRALAESGHEVDVFMPRYKSIGKEKFQLQLVNAPLSIKSGGEDKYAALLTSNIIPKIKVCFIDYEIYFGRDGLYGYSDEEFNDNAERFDFFAKAVIEAIKISGFCPDIIQCNDWHSGLIPFYLRTVYRSDPFFQDIVIVMTIHNAGYQGIFPEYSPDNAAGITSADLKAAKQAKGFSFLKAGVLYSDIITTVSGKYAEEIQTPEFGYDMAGTFRKKKDRLYGIRNAVDCEKWDPAIDRYLPANYSAKDLSGKKECRLELQRRMGLAPDASIPIIGTISRIVYQKGMDVLADSLAILLQDEDFQFVIMGYGDNRILHKFQNIKRMFPNNVGIFFGYDEELEHIIEAGLDIFIMPSRYEPCGLNQLYSLKYGTVPVVRATGGLDETVTEWDKRKKTGNGFKFKNLTVEELYYIVRKVIKILNDKNNWQAIQKNGQDYSYSWYDAVKEYEKIYNSAIKKRKKDLK